MRKILAVAGSLLFFIGCANDNQIQINNNAGASVLFNFRAHEYWVTSGGTQTISEIPNGTYEVNVGTELPLGTTSSSVSPGGTTFTFEKKSTKYLASFGSTFTNGVYAVTWNFTSTDSKGSVTAP
jgi:hypothetical protein